MRLLRGFLSPVEVAELGALDGEWLPGRQGTGYDKLPLRERLADHPAVLRARTVLVPHEDLWDVYVIRYLDGAHVPDHVDAAEAGKRHLRINAILGAPKSGGELRIGGVLVELSIGDAVLFEPDREVHHVTPVVGTRVVFSVGAWISEKSSSASSLTTP